MSGQQARPMTVGELSRRTGVPVKTLREYTDLGLVSQSPQVFAASRAVVMSGYTPWGPRP